MAIFGTSFKKIKLQTTNFFKASRGNVVIVRSWECVTKRTNMKVQIEAWSKQMTATTPEMYF